jgi:hypothetical protein
MEIELPHQMYGELECRWLRGQSIRAGDEMVEESHRPANNLIWNSIKATIRPHGGMGWKQQ